jgi:hypothetical protein
MKAFGICSFFGPVETDNTTDRGVQAHARVSAAILHGFEIEET